MRWIQGVRTCYYENIFETRHFSIRFCNMNANRIFYKKTFQGINDCFWVGEAASSNLVSHTKKNGDVSNKMTAPFFCFLANPCEISLPSIQAFAMTAKAMCHQNPILDRGPRALEASSSGACFASSSMFLVPSSFSISSGITTSAMTLE